MIKKYKKKPVVIEALQWTGDNLISIGLFTNGSLRGGQVSDLYIKTLEGDHKATIGDYIIKGVRGEFYPCKEDIFLETYEEVK